MGNLHCAPKQDKSSGPIKTGYRGQILQGEGGGACFQIALQCVVY